MITDHNFCYLVERHSIRDFAGNLKLTSLSMCFRAKSLIHIFHQHRIYAAIFNMTFSTKRLLLRSPLGILQTNRSIAPTVGNDLDYVILLIYK